MKDEVFSCFFRMSFVGVALMVDLNHYAVSRNLNI